MDGKKTLHEFSYYEKSETYIRRQFPRTFCMHKFQNMAKEKARQAKLRKLKPARKRKFHA